MSGLLPGVMADFSEFRHLRRTLHEHPETAFEEHETSRLIAERLAAWGIEVHRGMAGTGVVGVLRGTAATKSHRSIGLRADMDALPMQENNTFGHCSRHSGKMHGCGHDGHVTMLLAAARQLAQNPAFSGTIHFIFQPAEEGGSGAKRMIEEGLFERFPCDAVFALHNWPGLPAGSFATRAGPIMASCNEFRITVHGKGCHAAIPQQGHDPILVAAHIITALQSIVSRRTSPLDSAVLSVTRVNAGTGFNIIPDNAQIGGTVRTFTLPVLEMMEKQMETIARLTAQAHGCHAEFAFYRQSIPTVNDASQTAFAAKVMQDIVGVDKVDLNAEPTMGAEDFAFMLAHKPGCYAFIGNDAPVEQGRKNAGLHHPEYDFNDELIPLGASYWIRLAQTFLAQTD